MITCPWCGTSYTTFRSSCSRCGGLLPAPGPAPVPAGADEVEMPPPPPREISDKYRRKLLLGPAIGRCVLALIGGIIAACLCSVTIFVGIPAQLGREIANSRGTLLLPISGVIFLLGWGLIFLVRKIRAAYSGYRKAEKLVDVLRHGEAVVGQIVGMQPDYTSLSNGLPRLTISYQFRWNGRDYQNKIAAHAPPGPSFEPGRRVCVLCLPDAPEYNTLYPHPSP